jgi:hypothetical protein
MKSVGFKNFRNPTNIPRCETDLSMRRKLDEFQYTRISDRNKSSYFSRLPEDRNNCTAKIQQQFNPPTVVYLKSELENYQVEFNGF